MAYVADLHIHSRYSRACSPQLNIPNLVEWGKLKGINLLGTGDFLHPLWLTELKSQLTEDGSGFMSYNRFAKTPGFQTGDEGEVRFQDSADMGGEALESLKYKKTADSQSAEAYKNGNPSGSLRAEQIRFVLTVEIASIYTHKGSGRRIHNLVFMPDFASADKFQKALLGKRATLGSDGRPIVGIPSKELLLMALTASDKAIFIPAHAWTPWFGIFGSQSGYDSLKECFEDLTEYVYGIETGLSSDPAMNWRIPELDNKSILSFSDAHSLPNLGREASVFDEEFTYDGLFGAIKNQKIAGTIEFYPEEGKYHYTGHRNCNIKYSPEDTKAKGTICPVCKRSLTVGVMERVEEIAGRSNLELQITSGESGIIKSKTQPNRSGYRMLVPLLGIISEALHSTPTSQKVLNEYKKLVTNFGGEIKVLTTVSLEEIEKLAGPKIAEGVDKNRRGDLVIDPGYDGVYGVVKIWKEGEEVKEGSKPQLGLFDLHD